MNSVTFRVQDEDQKHIPMFPEFNDDLLPVDGEVAGIGLMQNATESGKAGLGLCVRHAGKIIYVPLTVAMFLTLAAGIRGTLERWGEPWEGA